VLEPYVCLYVCLSVTRQCRIETTGRIESVFGIEATLGYVVLERNWDIAKNMALPSHPLELCLKLGTFAKFRHRAPSVAIVVNFVRPNLVRRQFIRLSVHRCVQYYRRDAARRAASSAAADSFSAISMSLKRLRIVLLIRLWATVTISSVKLCGLTWLN